MTTHLTVEERMLGLTEETVAILNRLGVSGVTLAKTVLSAAERDPAPNPELSAVLVALKMAGKDSIPRSGSTSAAAVRRSRFVRGSCERAHHAVVTGWEVELDVDRPSL